MIPSLSQIWHKPVGHPSTLEYSPSGGGRGDPHNPVEADLRRSASSSACRTRLDKVVNKVCVSPGTSLSHTEKCRRLITSNRTGVAATTVAVPSWRTVISVVSSLSSLGLEECQEPFEGDRRPLGPVVELVADRVDSLVQEVGV